MANDQVSHRLLDTFGKKDREILDYLTPDRIVFNGHWNCFYPSILQDNSDLLAKKRRNPERWRPPAEADYKINVDGSFVPGQHHAGWGVAVRSKEGACFVLGLGGKTT